jgi:hypothetical protein
MTQAIVLFERETPQLVIVLTKASVVFHKFIL